jgi:SAM-dependent methyltransferase
MPTKTRRESVLRAFLLFAIAAVFLQLVVGILVFYLFEKWDERSYFGSMFGVASCLFSGLTLAGIILSLKFQSDELSITREELSRQFRLSLLRSVFSEMDQREVHVARNYVYRNFEKYASIASDPLLQQLDHESYEKADIVSNSFDRVGVLVLEDDMAKEVVLRCFGPSIARSWVALEPMIQILRKGRYGLEHEAFFEALAQAAIERVGRDRVEAMLHAWAGSSSNQPVEGIGRNTGEAARQLANEDAIARHEKEVALLARLPFEARGAYWDAFYNSAESKFLFSDDEVGRFGVIAELIRRQSGFFRVLDVGCGTGGLCALLQPGDSYIGIDISRTAVERASVIHPNRTFEVASLESFSHEADPFDFVVLSEMLFYVDPVISLKRASAFLKSDTGRLILSIYSSPSGDALYRLLKERLDLIQEIQITTKNARLIWHVALAKPLPFIGNKGLEKRVGEKGAEKKKVPPEF